METDFQLFHSQRAARPAEKRPSQAAHFTGLNPVFGWRHQVLDTAGEKRLPL
jgi:hypothetical protein